MKKNNKQINLQNDSLKVLFDNSFYSYPKTENHSIMWLKNDKINTCDLDSNCTQVKFNIKKNKNSKIFNQNYKNDNIEYNNIKENFKCTRCDKSKSNYRKNYDKENFECMRARCVIMRTISLENLYNYDTIVFYLIIIFIIILFYYRKK